MLSGFERKLLLLEAVPVEDVWHISGIRSFMKSMVAQNLSHDMTPKAPLGLSSIGYDDARIPKSVFKGSLTEHLTYSASTVK